ncbi:alpha/beta fold hydrolase [Streptococcus oricebi]|uniref:Alpha/beta hydrolase n=1 Tax=Streptococcus oricebi TaxID=1547447 RepID=A0ABS5B1T6_9STRE|nr:alpha/beta hydrolase [Streptococcus oricebi]MBP2622730.1 alpha/beta hydrolase [Streptococcus oricebi]
MMKDTKIEEIIENGPDRLYTICYPKPQKETIILLHGGPGAPDDFPWFAEEFKNDFQIITFHQRGTKKSPCPSGDYSIEAYMNDLNKISNYFGLKKFHLFGHSWGGLYAQIYASKYPKRLLSLFLCSPGTGTGSQWQQMEEEMMTYNKNHCSSAQWLKMGINSLLGSLGSSKASQALFRQVDLNYNADYPEFRGQVSDVSNASVKANSQTSKAVRTYPILTRLETPLFPITITFGDNDIFGDSMHFVSDRYPSAHLFRIKNSSHSPFLHNPQDFFPILHQHFDIKKR